MPCCSSWQRGARLPTPPDAGWGSAKLLVANSLSGEECRIRSTFASTRTDRLEQFDINCAGWQEPSGFVWRMPQVGQSNLAAMLVDEDLPLWQIKGISCGDLERAGGRDNAPTLVRRCTSEEGWPYLLLGVEDPDLRRDLCRLGSAPPRARIRAVHGHRGRPGRSGCGGPGRDPLAADSPGGASGGVWRPRGVS